MWRWDLSRYQISVIFLQLTRLSTSQRYELIKGVFHTATTRTSVFITPVPHMQSQEGQGEDCYICWFVFFFFFFFLLGRDKECGIWTEMPIYKGTTWAAAEAGLDLLDFFPYILIKLKCFGKKNQTDKKVLLRAEENHYKTEVTWFVFYCVWLRYIREAIWFKEKKNFHTAFSLPWKTVWVSGNNIHP